MAPEQIYTLTAVVLAVALDLGLMRWARRYWQRREAADPDGGNAQEVRLFGAFSPVLTWLKYRRLPQMRLGPDFAPAPAGFAVPRPGAADCKSAANTATNGIGETTVTPA